MRDGKRDDAAVNPLTRTEAARGAPLIKQWENSVPGLINTRRHYLRGETLIPPAKRGGDKRTVNIREVVNAHMYVLSTCCQWRAIPKDLPPRSTVHGYFNVWEWDGTLNRIHHALYVKSREAIGR